MQTPSTDSNLTHTSGWFARTMGLAKLSRFAGLLTSLLVVAATSVPHASAQVVDPSAKAVGVPAFGGEVKESVDSWITASVSAANPGETFLVAVVLDHYNAYHTYARAEEQTETFVIPTELTVKTDAEVGEIVWPESHELKADFGFGETIFPVYEKRSVIYVPVDVPADATSATKIEVTIEWQACDDEGCLPPEGESMTLEIPLGEDLGIAQVQADLFHKYHNPDATAPEGDDHGDEVGSSDTDSEMLDLEAALGLGDSANNTDDLINAATGLIGTATNAIETATTAIEAATTEVTTPDEETETPEASGETATTDAEQPGQAPETVAASDEANEAGEKKDETATAASQPKAQPDKASSSKSDSDEKAAGDTGEAGGKAGFDIAGIFSMLGGAILGGMILNLTPCVLPVIPIKILTLTQHAGGSRMKAIMLGLFMALGVTAFWLALGIPAALFSQFADPSRIFGYWFVTVGLGIVMVVLALGLMGMFTLNLPQSAYMVNPKADSPVGSFLFGVMAGVLGLPCFGFVAGGLLGVATTLTSIHVLAIFLGLGAGMAAPYLVLSAFPELLSRVPKTGPASDLVKHVLGLIMIGFGLWFTGNGIVTLIAQHPYIGSALPWIILYLGVATAGGLLVWKTFVITKGTAARTVFGLIGTGMVAASVVLALGVTRERAHEHEELTAAIEMQNEADKEQEEELDSHLNEIIELVEAIPATNLEVADLKEKVALHASEAIAAIDNEVIITNTWVAYTPERLEAAVAAGYPVFLDFTAEWCLTCKTYEGTVLNRDPVKSVLRGDQVVMMKIDQTGSNPDGDRLLDEIGRKGIPAWGVAGPGIDSPEAIGDFNADAVLEAIQRATGPQMVEQSS